MENKIFNTNHVTSAFFPPITPQKIFYIAIYTNYKDEILSEDPLKSQFSWDTWVKDAVFVR